LYQTLNEVGRNLFAYPFLQTGMHLLQFSFQHFLAL
jgi:hypothetical protein